MVIKVDGFMAGIEIAAFVDHRRDPAGFLMRAVGHDVGDADAFAVGLPGAFALVGGRSGTPEEVFRKLFSVFNVLLLFFILMN